MRRKRGRNWRLGANPGDPRSTAAGNGPQPSGPTRTTRRPVASGWRPAEALGSNRPGCSRPCSPKVTAGRPWHRAGARPRPQGACRRGRRQACRHGRPGARGSGTRPATSSEASARWAQRSAIRPCRPQRPGRRDGAGPDGCAGPRLEPAPGTWCPRPRPWWPPSGRARVGLGPDRVNHDQTRGEQRGRSAPHGAAAPAGAEPKRRTPQQRPAALRRDPVGRRAQEGSTTRSRRCWGDRDVEVVDLVEPLTETLPPRTPGAAPATLTLGSLDLGETGGPRISPSHLLDLAPEALADLLAKGRATTRYAADTAGDPSLLAEDDFLRRAVPQPAGLSPATPASWCADHVAVTSRPRWRRAGRPSSPEADRLLHPRSPAPRRSTAGTASTSRAATCCCWRRRRGDGGERYRPGRGRVAGAADVRLRDREELRRGPDHAGSGDLGHLDTGRTMVDVETVVMYLKIAATLTLPHAVTVAGTAPVTTNSDLVRTSSCP